jgi:hypothetical protein
MKDTLDWACGLCSKSGLTEVMPGQQARALAFAVIRDRHKLLAPECVGMIRVVDSSGREQRLSGRKEVLR